MADRGRFRRQARRIAADERGVGLVVVMQFVLVIAALGAMVTAAATYGQHSATQDSAGAAAQATTDAGVAEAINYIRSNGLQGLTCTEAVGGGTSGSGCSTPGWANPTSPMVVSGGVPLGAGAACGAGQDCFRVWIGTLQAYQPAKGAANGSSYSPPQPAVLRIHSTGLSGIGPGGRSVTSEVTAQPSRFPFGVFANTFQMPASTGAPANNESIFTTGNVTIKCPLSGLDYANNIPAAIHAAGTLTYQNGSCHAPSNSTATCSLTAPYDQDSNGVAWASTSPCYNRDQSDPAFSTVATTITPYSASGYFDTKGLAAYGYRPGGLSPQEYGRLKAQAQAEGTYNNHTNLGTVLSNLVAAGVTQPVIYFDDNTGSALDTNPYPVLPSQFFRSPTSSNCPNNQVVIVFRGAVTTHWTQTGPSNSSSLAGSVFLPDTGAVFNMDGQAGVIGTVFADSIKFNGNGAIQLDPCFVANPPGGVLDVTVLTFRSVDTTNVQ